MQACTAQPSRLKICSLRSDSSSLLDKLAPTCGPRWTTSNTTGPCILGANTGHDHWTRNTSLGMRVLCDAVEPPALPQLLMLSTVNFVGGTL